MDQPGGADADPGWVDTGSEDFYDADSEDDADGTEEGADVDAAAAAAATGRARAGVAPPDQQHAHHQPDRPRRRRLQLAQLPELTVGMTAGDAAVVRALLERAAAAADMAEDGGAGSEPTSGGSGSSGGGSATDDEADGQEAAGCRRFDPNVAARHQYLGDVDELEGSYGHLPVGMTARLPLLVLDGVVLFPGCQLPLLLSTPQELHLLDRAMQAGPPLTRLLAVLPGPRSLLRSMPRLVCCTAEVRQMQRRSGADEQAGVASSVAVLAVGRQRAEVVGEARSSAQSQVSVLVRVLSEGCQADVPRPIRQHCGFIHPALAAPWDLRLLAARVRQLMQLVLLPAASFQGSPLELSFWVAHNLPLQPATRQLLLMAPCPADRLRLLVELLQRLDRLCCSGCYSQLATTADVLAMQSEGIAGTYVNSHGYVHEMVTFRRVRGLQLYGAATSEHSWFDGYAWTIAHCATCGQHMGWRFTATEPGLTPRSFWGVRRPVLLCVSASGGGGGGGGEEAAAGHGDAAQPDARLLEQQQPEAGFFLRGFGRRPWVVRLAQLGAPGAGAHGGAAGT